MSAGPGPGRARFALRFRLGDIPVEVRPSVVLVLGFLGAGYGDPGLVVLWTVIGLVSILLHELGHALVARAGGATPAITLAGLGGVTTYSAAAGGGRRGWRLATSLAGPAVGLLIGGLAWVATREVAFTDEYLSAAVSFTLFTSIGWSLFNLLPVLPLDGGQALQQVLPGDPAQRRTRAAWVGVVVAVGGGLLAVMLQQTLLIVFAALFAFQNFQIATATDRHRRERADLDTLVDQGEWRQIRDTLQAGIGDRGAAARAQIAAAAAGAHQAAAEIGEVALDRGADDDPAFVERTAAAWETLGAVDRAAHVRSRLRS